MNNISSRSKANAIDLQSTAGSAEGNSKIKIQKRNEKLE